MATAESVAAGVANSLQIPAQEVTDMKTVLDSKIGSGDAIVEDITGQLGSLTRKLDDFFTMLKENDNSIKTIISGNAAVVNANAAEVADLKEKIGAKVGQSDSAFSNLQAALGAQQAEIVALKLQIGSMDERQREGTFGRSEGKSSFGIIDCKAVIGLEKLQNGTNFVSWTNRFRNAMEQYRPFATEAIKLLENQSLEVVVSTLKGLGGESGLYGYPDAIAELYDSKYPLGGIGIQEWNQLNRDL